MNNKIVNGIQALQNITGRNALVYYITDHKGKDPYEKIMNEYDLTRFRNCMSDMPKEKGLDIILRASGERMDDAEKIVKYLKEELNGDLRVIIPEIAAAAATVFACSAKEILMSDRAVLGSIEPYIGKYINNYIIKIYQDTKTRMDSDPGYYARLSEKESELLREKKAPGNKKAAPLYIDLADEVLENALYLAMFDQENANAHEIIEEILSRLNDKDRLTDPFQNQNHDPAIRMFSIQDCMDMKLNVKNLKDENLQDAVEALYQAVADTYEGTDTDKVILTASKVEEVPARAENVPQIDFKMVNTRMKELEECTERNVLVYYSDFYSVDHGSKIGVTEGDADKIGVCMNRLDKTRGLDMILHTPGGGTEEMQKILELINSYRMQQADIRVIVPQVAMSAGTVLASTGKVILMGKQTSLGPYDVQLGSLGAISDFIFEIETALDEMEQNPGRTAYWNAILSGYGRVWNALMGTSSAEFEQMFSADPNGKGRFLIRNLYAEMKSIRDTAELNEKKALAMFMFDQNKQEDRQKIDDIAGILNDRVISKTHGRRYDYAFCKGIGLNVQLLEEDPKLYQLVYELHDLYLAAFRNNHIAKIISVSSMPPYLTPLK